MKPPTHAVPSGDRRVAALLEQALLHAGHSVELASTFSSYERSGDAQRQAALRDEGAAMAENLIRRWRNATSRPDLWFTYHVYYKAPDWVGPTVSKALRIPYVIAEASYARKRAEGPWALGHAGCGDAIRSAALILCPSRDDIEGVQSVAATAARVVHLAPFLDPAPFVYGQRERLQHRTKLASEHGLDTSAPWILVVAMMRPGDKLASYQALAQSLSKLQDLPWSLLVAGDGTARKQVEAALLPVAGARVRFLGELTLAQLIPWYAAADVFAWPAVNEAYGMAMLEAQAAGLPVVSSELRGVPDVVCDGRTGLLAPAADARAFAAKARELLVDPARRADMGVAAANFVAKERSVGIAAQRLAQELDRTIATSVELTVRAP